MERTLTVGECQIPLKLTADSLFIYKANFSRDGFADIVGVDSSRDAFARIDVLLRLLWAFAKNKDGGAESFEEWAIKYRLNDGDVLSRALPEIVDMVTQFSQSSVKSRSASAGTSSNSERNTTESIMRRAVERGLSIADFGRFTLGMIVDYLVTCQNEDCDAKRNRERTSARQATQSDIDAF